MQIGSGWRAKTALRRSLCVAVGVVLVGLSGQVASAAPGDTTLVSRASGIDGAKGNHASDGPSISADGRFIAFESAATNLARGAHGWQVHVRDLQAHTTTLVSRSDGPVGPRRGEISEDAVISADGRFVAFDSFRPYADRSNLFVRDLRRRTTMLVSRNRSFASPTSISPDGRFVVFDADVPKYVGQVFVTDLRTHRTTLVSRATGRRGARGDATDFGSSGGSLSADGRLVVFDSDASNLVPGRRGDDFSGVYLRDLRSQTTTLISEGDRGVLSGDGHSVTFDASPHTLNGANPDRTQDVWVRDLLSGTISLASSASGPNGPAGNDDSYVGSISADGTRVAFTSIATNLSPDASGTVAVDDVFVRDLTTQTTSLVSRAGGDGPKGNHHSLDPDISADGRFVAFDSRASNLSPDDHESKQTDVFVRDVSGSS